MNFDAIIDVSSKVISIAENVPILNKSPAEQNFATFNAIFGVDVDDVQCLQSKRNVASWPFHGSAIYSKSFVLNTSVFDRNLTFMDNV